MTMPGGQVPIRYELRIEGHLDQHWSRWFDGFALTHWDDGTTTLRGVVTDQAELHGLLARVRDLGAVLISVDALDGRGDPHPLSPGAETASPVAVNEITTSGWYGHA